MAKIGLILILFLFTLQVSAQNQKLELSASQIETLFLNQNLGLIAEKLNVSIADAAIVQAKLWNNPTFSINGLNLWSTDSQRGGERIPPLFGPFGRNMQFSVELSQMVNVSGQRAKLVGIEKVSREMALVQFEQVLRGLKLELRKLIINILYLQQYTAIQDKQLEVLYELIASSERQYEKGNLSNNELIRIKSALLEIESEKSSTLIEFNAAQKSLKNLLSNRNEVSITVLPEEELLLHPETINLSELVTNAMEYRTDLNLQNLQTNYYKKMITYEKTKRVPDINLSVGYDRRGGVWRDFIGFGLGIDIPVFNRNQGAVKAAKISQRQSEILAQQQESVIYNEVVEAYTNYINTYALYQQTIQNKTTTQLDDMLKVYTKNLLDRNVSMVEYMDFLRTYKSTKQIAFATKRDVRLQLNDLEYIAAIYKKQE